MSEDLWRAIEKLQDAVTDLRKRLQEQDAHNTEDHFELRIEIERLKDKHHATD